MKVLKESNYRVGKEVYEFLKSRNYLMERDIIEDLVHGIAMYCVTEQNWDKSDVTNKIAEFAKYLNRHS